MPQQMGLTLTLVKQTNKQKDLSWILSKQDATPSSANNGSARDPLLLPSATVFVFAEMFTQSSPEGLHGNRHKSVKFEHDIFSALAMSNRV